MLWASHQLTSSRMHPSDGGAQAVCCAICRKLSGAENRPVAVHVAAVSPGSTTHFSAHSAAKIKSALKLS